jgi:5-formyltetrahydrofolate cyclo-ligase
MDAKAKKLSRERIWRELTERRVATFPLPAFGRVPNFVGSDAAADKVKQLDEWKNAKVVFANPDAAQHKVRANALKEGKVLVMASPRLKHGLIVVDSGAVKGKEEYASTIRGAFEFGKETSDFPKPDLIVTSCVAVDEEGHRFGKGHGCDDVEIRMVKEKFGRIPVVTTVHDLQVVTDVPFESHDESVDVIVTPTRVVRLNLNSVHLCGKATFTQQ